MLRAGFAFVCFNPIIELLDNGLLILNDGLFYFRVALLEKFYRSVIEWQLLFHVQTWRLIQSWVSIDQPSPLIFLLFEFVKVLAMVAAEWFSIVDKLLLYLEDLGQDSLV